MTNINISRGFKKFKPTVDGSEVNIIYSTPSCYAKAVRDAVEANSIELNVKTDDFFPYADSINSVWSGYFTSRPTSKRLERFANNLLQVKRNIWQKMFIFLFLYSRSLNKYQPWENSHTTAKIC